MVYSATQLCSFISSKNHNNCNLVLWVLTKYQIANNYVYLFHFLYILDNGNRAFGPKFWLFEKLCLYQSNRLNFVTSHISAMTRMCVICKRNVKFRKLPPLPDRLQGHIVPAQHIGLPLLFHVNKVFAPSRDRPNTRSRDCTHQSHHCILMVKARYMNVLK